MKKQIIFIEGYSTVMLYKIAGLFKKRGYQTVLIRILEQNQEDRDFYDKAYDKVINLNFTYHKVSSENFSKILFSFSKKIKQLFSSFYQLSKLKFSKPYVIFGRSPLSIPIAFFKIFFNKIPFVYFPYDIRSQAIANYKEAKKHLPGFEIWADRYCFEHSDGILHKGSPDELEYLNGRMLGDNIKLPKHTITFHPYCSKEFIIPLNKNKLSKRDKEVHFVFIGGPLKPNIEYYYQQLKDFKELIKQKMHVHFYYCAPVSEKRDLKKEEKIKIEFFEEYKNYSNIKYFHIHPPLDPREIIKEISKYDFGTEPYTREILKNHGLALKFHTGNKIAAYLEAGIPFLYRNESEFIDKLMKSYNLNLNWPENITLLKSQIKKLNYKQLEKNIEKARKDFLMEKHFPRLEKFVKDVVKSKTT